MRARFPLSPLARRSASGPPGPGARRRLLLRSGPLLGLLALLGGCLLVDEHVALRYEPSPNGRVAALEASARPDLPQVEVATFQDERPDAGGRGPTRLGERRNGLDLRTAEITTRDDVALWVTEAARAELRAAGFAVPEEAPSEREAAPEAGVARLSGTVRRVLSTPRVEWDAEVELSADLWLGDRRLLHRRYVGVAQAPPGSGEPLEQAFARALRNALLQVVADADHVLAPR